MKKAVIIGAGPAGLTAAYELLSDGGDYEVTVLEKTDRLGGIACTVQFGGNYMDLGGHRFYSKSEAVTDWWLTVPGVPLLKKNRKSEIYYKKRFIDYPIKLSGRTFAALGVGELARCFCSYLAARLHKREEDSLEDFYVNRFGRRLYELFFRDYTEKVWGIPPSGISPDWGSQRVKGLSIFAVLADAVRSLFGLKDSRKAETSLTEEFYYPPHGPGELWTAVGERVKSLGGEIKLNCSVTKLYTENNRVTGLSYNENGVERRSPADIVISTMPIRELIAGMDGVPAGLREAANGLVYRDFITVGVLVRRLAVATGDCWIYVQDKGVRMGRVQVFNNWSEKLVKDPAATTLLGLEYFCDKGDALWSLSDVEMAALAAAELVKIGLIPGADAVRDSHVERLEKAYPAYFGSYGRMPELRAYLDGVRGLYCIGRNGQHRYNNMDHSMLTAIECVKCIKNGGSRDAVWQVNTEKEYN